MRRLTATQALMLRGLGLFAAIVVFCGAVGGIFGSADVSARYTGTAGVGEASELRQSLQMAMGETEIRSLQLGRANVIMEASSRYGIPADLAALIHDEAVRAGVEPELAFRLGKAESNFSPRSRRSAAACGRAQVQRPTARHYDPAITEKGLYDPQRNLRIGFRYL